MLNIYKNVKTIVHEADPLSKSNEEDLIGIVEAIENIKVIISKKKESVKIPFLKQIKNDVEALNKRLNLKTSSKNYRENHNLPEYNYQNIQPFTLQNDENKRIEENKVGDVDMQPSDYLFQKIKQPISNYSKAVDQLDKLEMGDNDSNLFGANQSRASDLGGVNSSVKTSHNFLNLLLNYINSDSGSAESDTLFSMISEFKVKLKNGKIYNANDDQIMDGSPIHDERSKSSDKDQSKLSLHIRSIEDNELGLVSQDLGGMGVEQSDWQSKNHILNEQNTKYMKPFSKSDLEDNNYNRQNNADEGIDKYDKLVIGARGDNEDDDDGLSDDIGGFGDFGHFDDGFKNPDNS